MFENLDNRQRTIRLVLLFLTPGFVVATVAFFLWQSNPDIEYWKGLAQEGRYFLETHPWALILAVAILPGLGFPVSPLLILFGIVLGPRYGAVNTSLIAILALSFCSIWSYALSAGPLRQVLKNLILRKRELPDLTTGNAFRLGFIVRITPGFPYALQNVVLGVIGLNFKTYLIVSIPLQSLYAVGFVVTGGAIFKGQAGLAITGFLVLVVAILVARILRSRSKRNVG